MFARLIESIRMEARGEEKARRQALGDAETRRREGTVQGMGGRPRGKHHLPKSKSVITTDPLKKRRNEKWLSDFSNRTRG